MPFPQGFKKQLKLTPQIVGVERREEILNDIAEGGGFLPRGVDYEDMDSSFINFVENDLKIVIDGEQVPVLFLTIQRYSEFTKTWKFTDKYRNISMPFISIVRQPDPQVGTNQAGLYNIPGRQHWTYYKVPSNDGVRHGIDIYKIPQPTATDITYEVRLFTNKMSDLNVLNQKIQKAFNAIQYYIWPKGHPMPIKLANVGDESNIDDFENRRFYVQNFEMLLQGYILDENDFVVEPTVNRAMVLSEITTDPATAEPRERKRDRPPIISAQGSVIIRNSANQTLASVECGNPYVVGNTNILNSGSTFSVNVPATSGYMLPNITHYDCDGSPVTLPAQTSFTATSICSSGTVTNFNVTYSATVASGGLLVLPNINVSGNSQLLYMYPSVSDVNLNITNGFDLVGAASGVSWYVSASTITNSGSTYSQNIPAESGFTLPNIVNYDSDGSPVETPAMVGFTATTCQNVTIINSGSTYSASTPAGSLLILPNTPIFSTLSGFTSSTPSVSTGYTISDIVWTDSNLSGMTTEYGQPIVCTPIPTPDEITLSLWSDSGQTIPVANVVYGQTIYGSLTWFSTTPINSIVIHQPIGNDVDYLEVPINVLSPTFTIDVLNVGTQPWYVIMDNGNTVADEYNLTSSGTTPPNLYMVIDVADTSTSAPITIVTGNDGTITSVDDGGLTSLVISVNASPVTVPFAIVATDSVVFTYDAAVGDAQIILTGTYA